MNREIQIVSVAFIDNESHSKYLKFAVHGSWDEHPPFNAVFKGFSCPRRARVERLVSASGTMWRAARGSRTEFGYSGFLLYKIIGILTTSAG